MTYINIILPYQGGRIIQYLVLQNLKLRAGVKITAGCQQEPTEK